MHVVLVHGTWGRRSRWAFSDSDLARTLLEHLGNGTDTRRFEWKGGNRHRHRIDAAAELAEVIDALPNENVGLVAHSHGGNVARAAMAQTKTSKRVTLVSVGTPFLTVESTVRRQQNWIFPALAILVLVDVVFQWRDPNLGFEYLRSLDPNIRREDALAAPRVILGVGATIAGVTLLWRLMSWLSLRPLSKYGSHALAEAIAPASTLNDSVHALAVTGDEAGLALGVGQALTYAGKRTAEATTRYVLTVLPFLVTLIAANIIVNITDLAQRIPSQYLPGPEYVYFVRAGVWMAAVLAVALYLFEIVGVAATGWDGPGLPVGHISISLTPTGRHVVFMLLPSPERQPVRWWSRNRDLDDGDAPLRHGQLMERPDVADHIAAALSESFRDGQPD